MPRKCWDQRIKEAKERGFFTETDKKYARFWSSCSVGEGTKLKTNMRTDSFNKTFNDSLLALGVYFNHAVKGDDIIGARKLHKSIKKEIKEVNALLTRQRTLKAG